MKDFLNRAQNGEVPTTWTLSSTIRGGIIPDRSVASGDGATFCDIKAGTSAVDASSVSELNGKAKGTATVGVDGANGNRNADDSLAKEDTPHKIANISAAASSNKLT
ncbi:hypothetical protein PsorP6_002094 [Peronosclerospora sorghi]|uniref:Uncharacterized protein n=1 Tax=Peronosclerospora sorghi TaxID=230839 RepID=A0ACC0WQH0_9STRA|nr:hypothetical protein PsorP6_002094 [Peronosclerospora sorghi]